MAMAFQMIRKLPMERTRMMIRTSKTRMEMVCQTMWKAEMERVQMTPQISKTQIEMVYLIT